MFPIGRRVSVHRTASWRRLRALLTAVIPFLVHDLNLVPTEQRKNAKLMYTYWLILIVTLIVNFVGCIFLNK